MLKRLVRRSLRRCGIRVSFPGLICAEYIKSVCIGSEGHAKITVQKKLVFLEMPETGDLHDTCTVDPETTLETFVRHSTDSVDGARRQMGSGALEIEWMPSSAVTRYALHEHEYEWSPIGSQLQPALCAEYVCDAKTGHFLCELITPQAFEAAIVFERPRWPLLNTERRIMRYALKQIDAGGGRPGHFRERPANRMANRRAETRDAISVRRLPSKRLAVLERRSSEKFPGRPDAPARGQACAGLAQSGPTTAHLTSKWRRSQNVCDHLDV